MSDITISETFEIDDSLIDEAARTAKPVDKNAPQTQELLVDAIVKELKRLTKDMRFPSPDGDVELNIFKQLLPLHKTKEEKKSDFPFILVKFERSDTTDVSQRQTVSIVLGIGLWYGDEDRQYQHYAYHIYNVIVKRFIADNFLENYRCEPEFSFALSPEDETTYPHYYAAIGMTWMIPGIDRERDFWNDDFA